MKSIDQIGFGWVLRKAAIIRLTEYQNLHGNCKLCICIKMRSLVQKKCNCKIIAEKWYK